MKNNYLLIMVILILIVVEIINIDKITDKTVNIINNRHKLVIQSKNEYYKDYDFLFIKNSTDYIPYSYNDLLDIFYSTINNGWDSFTFYCPQEYEKCLSDISDISKQETLLTQINNYASPFNSFSSVETIYDDSGEVTININKTYTKEEITSINNEIDKIFNEVLNDEMDDNDKILSLHDYIINNTKYDVEKNNTGVSNYNSNKANGALLEGYATCNGYADVMAIMLDRLGIKNYKIASENHIWNAVYINDEWLHLDLTWDDPVAKDGKDYLYHKYFLVNNEELFNEDKDLTDHQFEDNIYLEFKD